ncbi:MAG: helix-turn-helix transcriptional regulator [bacterium]
MPSKKPVPCSLRARFGRNVAAMRIGAGITQEQAAERSGLSSRYWQSIEAGEYFPPIATLVRIKAMLDCSWEALFDGCD